MKAIVNDDNGALLLSDLTFNACESKVGTVEVADVGIEEVEEGVVKKALTVLHLT